MNQMFDHFRYDGEALTTTKRRRIGTNESGVSTIQPFIAPPPNRYREKFSSICGECFEKSIPCPHFEETPLRLLIIGHNPSKHAWCSGYFYSNPTNRMWKLLTDAIVQSKYSIEDQNILPSEMAIGFTDVGLFEGSNAASFTDGFMKTWIPDFYRRLLAHSRRATGGPEFIAFAGKRQFKILFETGKIDIQYGEQTILPVNWPLRDVRVWVLPSSSGRAVMTSLERSSPYTELACELEKKSSEFKINN